MAVGARFILLIRRACSSHDQHEPLLHGDHSSNNVYGVPTGRTYTVVIPYGVPLLIPRIQGASTVRVIYRFTLQCTPLLMGYSLFCYSGDEGGILPPPPIPKYSGFPYTRDSAWFLRVLREPPSNWIAKSTFPRTGLKVNRDSGLSKPSLQ